MHLTCPHPPQARHGVTIRSQLMIKSNHKSADRVAINIGAFKNLVRNGC